MSKIMRQETEQEKFWKADFGTEYSQRNVDLASSREPFFRSIIERTGPLKSVCELGSNVGENLRALRGVAPEIELAATEINPTAFEKLKTIPGINAVNGAIQDYSPGKTFQLVFTSGVLIHLNPDDLNDTYRKMFELSQEYVLFNEYFSPVPVEIPYRGHQGKLFKRDFAGEFWDIHKDSVELVDYGFLWKKADPVWDDTNWTLFRKK